MRDAYPINFCVKILNLFTFEPSRKVEFFRKTAMRVRRTNLNKWYLTRANGLCVYDRSAGEKLPVRFWHYKWPNQTFQGASWHGSLSPICGRSLRTMVAYKRTWNVAVKERRHSAPNPRAKIVELDRVILNQNYLCA